MLILLSPAKTFNFDLMKDHNTGTTLFFNVIQKLSLIYFKHCQKKTTEINENSPKLAALNKDRHLSFTKTQ